jgi:hypothetical protein
VALMLGSTLTIKLSHGDCSFQFGRASAPTMRAPQPRAQMFGAGANTEHGYAGIEDEVVKEIADFVKDVDHH